MEITNEIQKCTVAYNENGATGGWFRSSSGIDGTSPSQGSLWGGSSVIECFKWEKTSTTTISGGGGGGTDITPISDILGVATFFMIWVVICYGVIKLFKIFS